MVIRMLTEACRLNALFLQLMEWPKFLLWYGPHLIRGLTITLGAGCNALSALSVEVQLMSLLIITLIKGLCGFKSFFAIDALFMPSADDG